MVIKDKVIIADDGKVLQRISDGVIFGKELWLGFTHYLGGELLPEPLYELPEHYREIDEPTIEEVFESLNINERVK